MKAPIRIPKGLAIAKINNNAQASLKSLFPFFKETPKTKDSAHLCKNIAIVISLKPSLES